MDAEQITAVGGAVVGGLGVIGGVIAAALSGLNARRSAEASADAMKAAAQIGRDHNREAEFRQRRIEAFRQLARSCASSVEAIERWGEIGLAIVEREHRSSGTHVAKRRSEQAQLAEDVKGAFEHADAVWSQIPTDSVLRALLLDVELVGPSEVIPPARAYVQKIIVVKEEVREAGLRSFLATGTLAGLEPEREAMYAAMREATGEAAAEPAMTD